MKFQRCKRGLFFLAMTISLLFTTGVMADDWEIIGWPGWFAIDGEHPVRKNFYDSDTVMGDRWFCGQNGEDSEIPHVPDLLKYLLSGNDSVLSVKLPNIPSHELSEITFYYGGDVGPPRDKEWEPAGLSEWGDCSHPNQEERCNETIHAGFDMYSGTM